jgi:hypothetical protein
MRWLNEGAAATVVIGPFLDDTDGKTPETALTISQADVRLSKNGGAFAQKGEASSCTHLANGYYACALNATDTGTVGALFLTVNESGALPVWHEFMVLDSVAYGVLVTGGNEWPANLTKVGGDSTAATNLYRAFSSVVVATAVTGTLTTTGFTTNLSSAVNDFYNGRLLTFVTGALAGQQTSISDYTGATKLITCPALTGAPANGDIFVIS